MSKGQDLYRTAKKIIPGGTQLLSKRPEMFLPGVWPAYYDKAKGSQIWDLDGNKYIDTSFMGIGSCILGYADKDVDNAVKAVIRKGTMATLNCPEEVELARVLCRIHPWAGMVRYARTGGEAVAVAVRMARAKTGKSLILFCGYHGWHDWYLSANLANNKALDGHLLQGLAPEGVPRALKGTAIPFNYNDKRGFMKLISRYKDKIAAVVMEPVRNYYPQGDFLKEIRRITKQLDIVLVFDEITSAWRLGLGGAHLKFGVNPDMAVFAKGMSNGYAMAAIIGKKKIMQTAQDTFISSTYWTERVGPVAALATIEKMRDKDVAKYLINVGKKVQKGWQDIAKRYNLGISVSGIYPLGHFSFVHKRSLIFKTLFTQYMLEEGFLATNSFYVSYAHKSSYIKRYLDAVDNSFNKISKIIRKEKPEKYLKGAVCHSGFKRLT